MSFSRSSDELLKTELRRGAVRGSFYSELAAESRGEGRERILRPSGWHYPVPNASISCPKRRWGPELALTLQFPNRPGRSSTRLLLFMYSKRCWEPVSVLILQFV